MNRGKRFARGNRIGKEGELVFAKWALKNNLSANKAETDLGIDYFCQVLQPVAGSESQEVEGAMLGAQVKGVEAAPSSRVVLDRVDAENLLRQTQATCVFGVYLEDESVHFQFVNRKEVDRLTDFLESDQQEITLPYSEMASDSKLFSRQLMKLANSFEQSRLRIHQIQRRLRKAIHGLDFELDTSDQELACRVYVPWVSSVFSVDPSAREQVRLRMFNEGLIDPNSSGVELHPEILRTIRETHSSTLMIGGALEKVVTLQIQSGDKSETAEFSVRSFEDEVAYVHKAGLRLTTSAARETANGWVHEFENDLFHPAKRVPLSGRSLVFFRLFRPGAILRLPTGTQFPLSQFGESLEHVGPALEPVPALCEALRIPLSSVELADLKDEEFGRTIWLLDELLLKAVPIDHFTSGYIVGDAVDLPLDQIPTCLLSVSVPIVFNWKRIAIAVWVDCVATGFLHDDLLCGFRIEEQRGWKVEKLERQTKSIFPELWIAKDWPALKIGSGQDGVQTWKFDPAVTLPFEAVITRIPRETETTSS